MENLIDPNKVVVDPSVPDLWIQDVEELTVAVPVGNGTYVISKRIPNDECWIVTAVTPFAWARTKVGDSAEGVERISSKNADGFFLFQPQVNGKDALGLSMVHIPLWTTAAGATLSEPFDSSGLNYVSDAPFDETARAAGNNLNRFLVGSGQSLTVLFSLIPDAATAPLPQRYVIGGATPTTLPLLRVDRAGVIMVGKKCPKQYYDGLKLAMLQGHHGKG